MVEENAIGGENAVGLPVIAHNPVSVLLRRRIGRIGVEGSCLALGDLLHFSEELRGGRLVEFAAFL